MFLSVFVYAAVPCVPHDFFTGTFQWSTLNLLLSFDVHTLSVGCLVNGVQFQQEIQEDTNIRCNFMGKLGDRTCLSLSRTLVQSDETHFKDLSENERLRGESSLHEPETKLVSDLWRRTP